MCREKIYIFQRESWSFLEFDENYSKSNVDWKFFEDTGQVNFSKIQIQHLFGMKLIQILNKIIFGLKFLEICWKFFKVLRIFDILDYKISIV